MVITSVFTCWFILCKSFTIVIPFLKKGMMIIPWQGHNLDHHHQYINTIANWKHCNSQCWIVSLVLENSIMADGIQMPDGLRYWTASNTLRINLTNFDLVIGNHFDLVIQRQYYSKKVPRNNLGNTTSLWVYKQLLSTTFNSKYYK